MKFSIFGANGFIGSNMINYLKSQNIECESVTFDDEKLFEKDYIKLRLNKNSHVFLELNNKKLKNNNILDNLGLAMYKIDNLSQKTHHIPQFQRQIYKFLNNIKSKNDLKVIKDYLKTKKNKIDITNFNEYIKKIMNISNPKSLLIFETMSQDTYFPERFEPKLSFLKENFEILEDRIIESEYPVNVPKRRFFIFRKL